MNNTHKNASKTIALFLSLGLMSSLAGCEIGGEGGEDGDNGDAPTQQPASEDEGGEGGEDG